MFCAIKYEIQNLKLIYFFGVLSPGTSGQDLNPPSEDYELSGGPRVHPCLGHLMPMVAAGFNTLSLG